MTVTITKPEINLREELSAVKSPTGVFGEQLGRVETVTDFYNLTGQNKNLIINGDMRFSQRGDYSSGYTNAAATPVYTIDRFFNRPYGADPQTITHNSVVLPDGTYTKSMKVQQTGTVNNTPFYHMIQMLEVERWMLGKTFTVSYWYRTNTPRIRGRYCDTLSCYANIGEDMIADEQWHYNVWQMRIPTNATIGGGAQMHPAFTKADGANILGGEYFEFTLLQMELGTVATPFEFRSAQTELALCQRYFVAFGTPSLNQYVHLGVGSLYSTTAINLAVALPTAMRTTPSVSRVNSGANVWLQVYIGASGTNSDAPIQVGEYLSVGSNTLRLYLTGSTSGSVGQATWCQVMNGAQLQFSAEF